MLAELVSVVGMANATNRMVNAYRVEPDPKLIEAAKGGKK
jgi:alkylhydroperoxidase family enzyme